MSTDLALDAYDGIMSALRTVSGLALVQGQQAPQAGTAAIVSYTGAVNRVMGRIRVDVWRFHIRVAIPFHENRIAEREIIKFAHAVPAALETDRTLGGRANIVGDIDQSADPDSQDGMYTPPGTDTMMRSIVFRFDVTGRFET